MDQMLEVIQTQKKRWFLTERLQNLCKKKTYKDVRINESEKGLKSQHK